MKTNDEYSNAIHLSLKGLIEQKSKRDGVPFTIYQLSKAIGMPHSMLVKLMHLDPEKRVINPRVDTLAKIVDFFKADGFNITIDDLFEGLNNQVIDVQAQPTGTFLVEKNIPVYAFNSLTKSIGAIDIKLTVDSDNLLAFILDEDMKPLFKAGSIFIVDKNAEPEDDTLVAVQVEGYSTILIRRLSIKGSTMSLLSFDDNIKPIVITPTISYQVIGVVVQVNAKT